jgi:hypothetical protein
MKLRLTEDPKDWRKAAWQGAGGLAVMSTLLRWRRILPNGVWLAALAVLALVAVCAWWRPAWFRGYYRFTSRLGFGLAQLLARIVLAAVFVLAVVPLGWALRIFGKDPLQLKLRADARTFWRPAEKSTPLDRLF